MEVTRSLGRRPPDIFAEPQPLSHGYESVCIAVTEILEQYYSSYLCLQALINRKESAPEATFLCIVPNEAESVSYDANMLSKLEKFFSKSELRFQLCRGNIYLQNSLDPRNPDYYDVVENGASIAPEGQHWSGSFGGYLQDRNTQQIFGVTCAHNVCKYGVDEDRPAAELVELLDPGTIIMQPSPADRNLQLKSLDNTIRIIANRLMKLHKMNELDPDASKTPAIAKVTGELRDYEEKRHILATKDTRFAKTTDIAELAIDNGELLDYVLLEVIAPGRLGSNRMTGIPLQQSNTDITTIEDKIHMVGRTSGPSSGMLRGYLCDAKVERFPQKFRSLYAYGMKGKFMSEAGDSGAWVRAEDTAIGYVFGGGGTDEVLLESSWILDLNKVCARINERWGKDLCVYED